MSAWNSLVDAASAEADKRRIATVHSATLRTLHGITGASYGKTFANHNNCYNTVAAASVAYNGASKMVFRGYGPYQGKLYGFL